MNLPKWSVGVLVSFCASAFLFSARGEEKPAGEVIIKMDPYVVSGERVLPPPEDWNYAYVPATELERGKKVVQSPGYEILSNLDEKNTKVFVDELQLRQLAGSLLWPMIAQSLPREPMVVIIDRSKQAAGDASRTNTLTWAGEPIADVATSSLSNSFDSGAFSTGTQIVSPGDVLNPDDPNDPNAETTTPATNRYVADGALTTPEPSSFEQRWLKPLPAGFTYVRAKQGIVAAQINADDPLAGASPPSEELLAADLSRRAAEFALFTFTEPPPRWFQSGIGWLIATTRVSPTRISFADTGGMLDKNALPSLAKLINKTTALTYEEDLLSAAFTHWGLYGDDKKHAPQFMTFVQKQSQGPVSEEQFTQIFGFNIKKLERVLSDYTHSMTSYKSRQLDGNFTGLPAATIRKATQSEVARLQANSLITQGKPDAALNALRIAYWRGEREPAMLAILADLEESLGSIDRARKITQALMALPTPPARVFIVEARLRYRDILASKKPEEKLTAKETRTIMDPLGRAVQVGQNSEEIWTFFSEIVLRSGGRPHESITTLLERASKRFPKNTRIQEALAFAKPANP